MTAPYEFVERIGIRKDGKGPLIRTHRLDWAVCDQCGEGLWTNRLEKTKTDSVPGLKCCMTSKCAGKHRKDEP